MSYGEPEHAARFKCIEDICIRKITDFTEDVVVYPGILNRHYDTNLMNCIRISNSLKNEVIDFAKKNYLFNNTYDVIHLRGGSKSWMGGVLPKDSPVKNLHNQWDNPYEYMEEIWYKYKKIIASKPQAPLFIISDTSRLIDLWIKKYNTGIGISNLASSTLSECGIHKLKAKDLSDLSKITKKEVNFECIRDFIIMLNSRILVGDDVTLFSSVALLAKNVGIRLVNLNA